MGVFKEIEITKSHGETEEVENKIDIGNFPDMNDGKGDDDDE